VTSRLSGIASAADETTPGEVAPTASAAVPALAGPGELTGQATASAASSANRANAPGDNPEDADTLPARVLRAALPRRPNEASADDTVPDDTVPDDTVPDDTVPDDTVPDDTVADEAGASAPGEGSRGTPVQGVAQSGGRCYGIVADPGQARLSGPAACGGHQ
jgi:hypothetical protein